MYSEAEPRVGEELEYQKKLDELSDYTLFIIGSSSKPFDIIRLSMYLPREYFTLFQREVIKRNGEDTNWNYYTTAVKFMMEMHGDNISLQFPNCFKLTPEAGVQAYADIVASANDELSGYPYLPTIIEKMTAPKSEV